MSLIREGQSLEQNRAAETYFRAISGARRLLEVKVGQVDSNDLHKLKSVFYVAVERLGMRADRLFSLQRQLREVFSIINMRSDLTEFERQAALQLVDELEGRLTKELKDNIHLGGNS